MKLCEDLGHDPAKISGILIEPSRITVTYIHPLEGSGFETDIEVSEE